MKLLNKIFAKPTNYLPQVIPPKPLELINAIDDWHTRNNQPIDGKTFCIEEVIIPLSIQHWAVSKMFQPTPSDDAYIPRSIAFYITPSGDWIFLIGIYRNNPTQPSDMTTRMWLELLTRTNSARESQ